jgi:hypothetical protein
MTIKLTRKEAQEVLEAFEGVFEGDDKGAEFWTVYGGTFEAVYCMNAMRLLRAKLSEPEPEPVARNYCREIYEVWAGSEGIPMPETAPEAYLLHLVEQMRDIAREGLHTASQREWQGLTVDEFYDLDDVGRKMILEYGRLVEAKLRELNLC